MSRYILRFRGTGPIPGEAVEQIRALSGIKVLDDSASRMLLVEGQADELEALLASMPEWVMIPERIIQLPDPRPRIKESKEKPKRKTEPHDEP